MINDNLVTERLFELTGLDESEERLLPLSREACAFLENRLKDGVSESDSRIITCAAMIAYGKYLSVSSAENSDISSMKAGDLSVSISSSKASLEAKRIIEASLADCADLLLDTEFMFGAF